MGVKELLSTGPSSSGTPAVSVGVEVSCCVLTGGRGLMTGGCVGTLLSGGAALQPSGSARRADLERTRDDPTPPLTVLSCGILYVSEASAVTDCVDV